MLEWLGKIGLAGLGVVVLIIGLIVVVCFVLLLLPDQSDNAVNPKVLREISEPKSYSSLWRDYWRGLSIVEKLLVITINGGIIIALACFTIEMGRLCVSYFH